jgi:hypothetical protein
MVPPGGVVIESQISLKFLQNIGVGEELKICRFLISWSL